MRVRGVGSLRIIERSKNPSLELNIRSQDEVSGDGAGLTTPQLSWLSLVWGMEMFGASVDCPFLGAILDCWGMRGSGRLEGEV